MYCTVRGINHCDSQYLFKLYSSSYFTLHMFKELTKQRTLLSFHKSKPLAYRQKFIISPVLVDTGYLPQGRTQLTQ